MSPFLLSTLSAIGLLLAASGTYVLSKKFRFPYTVALVAIGMLVAWVAHTVPAFAFLDDFRLTPEVLLYVFLPILLFESAYNIPYKDLLKNSKSVSLLAIVSLVISATAVAFALKLGLSLFGIEVPIVVTLLFWALISATDPVAVLALFKELGAPKRLSLIFEGESLFNDGTALAFFLVVLGIAVEMGGGGAGGHSSAFVHVIDSMGIWTVASGIASFGSMVVSGFAFGAFAGAAFSLVLGKVRNEPFLELALTLVLAHATFLASEVLAHFVLPTSGVIATTVAAMVVGNYGRFKISPPVEKIMGHYWEFFAFLANSLVFILIGILVAELPIDWKTLAVPTVLAVFVVMAARALSVYPVIGFLNLTKTEERIPLAWQHLLSWGSLRGGLAVIMVLLIPADLTVPGWTLAMPVRDFILALTVGCIVFTVFVKATTIFPLMRKFDLVGFWKEEEIEYAKGRLRILLDVRSKLDRMEREGRIPEEESSLLWAKYERELEETETLLKNLLARDPKTMERLIETVVARHAFGLEKYWLKELYAASELPERTLKELLRKIARQTARIEAGKPPIRLESEPRETDAWERMADFFDSIGLPRSPERDVILAYAKVRARDIVCERVILDLSELERIEFLSKSGVVAEVKKRYAAFGKKAESERKELYRKYRDRILPLDSKLADKTLLLVKNRVLDELVAKSVLPPKVITKLREEIETDLYAGVV